MVLLKKKVNCLFLTIALNAIQVYIMLMHLIPEQKFIWFSAKTLNADIAENTNFALYVVH